MKPITRLCFATLAALCCAPAASALRCDGYVIDVGLKKIEVIKRCGMPSSKETRVVYRTSKVRNPVPVMSTPRSTGVVEQETQVQISIEEWIYNFGPSQFMQQLTFEDGYLVEIEDIGYGS